MLVLSTGRSDEDSNFDRDPEQKLQVVRSAHIEVAIPDNEPDLDLKNQGTKKAIRIEFGGVIARRYELN